MIRLVRARTWSRRGWCAITPLVGSSRLLVSCFQSQFFPLVFDSHFLVHHGGKMSLAWALIFAVPYLIAFRGEAFYDILHIYLIDYIPFIILLWGLFTVAGGILVRGTLRGTPIVNTLLLLIGTAIASWVGTTGASMLLIRPSDSSKRIPEKQSPSGCLLYLSCEQHRWVFNAFREIHHSFWGSCMVYRSSGQQRRFSHTCCLLVSS